MKTTMKIEYRKLTDKESDPWLLLTNIDELIWNGVYALRVAEDNGSSGLPFRFDNNDTVTIVVKDHSHEGALQNYRTIVQSVTRVERATGNVFTYTRTRYNSNGNHRWSFWNPVTEDGNTIDMPKASATSPGAVIIGDGLSVDGEGKISIADNTIDESKLSNQLNGRINDVVNRANLADRLCLNNCIVLDFGALVENNTPYKTKYCVCTDKILANGETIIASNAYKISGVKIFDGEQELYFDNTLNLDEYILTEKGRLYQFEFKKVNTALFTEDELPKVIKSFVQNAFTWKSDSYIDSFTAQGVYNIKGNRTNRADGLPIYNTGAIDARLTVLVSGDCITQVLTLLNVAGGDGNIYVRTKQNGVWDAWGKLQSNIEAGSIGLGQSKTFDDLTDNGIYSGVNVYAIGTGDDGYPITSCETFVLVVINAYLTGGGVSQLKYSLLLDGTTSVATRTKQNDEWSEWGNVANVDNEIKEDSKNPVQNRVVAQALKDAVEEGRRLAKRDLFVAAGAEYNDSEVDITRTAPWGETVTHKAGHYYLNGLGDITEEQMVKIYNRGLFIESEYSPFGYAYSLFNEIRTNIGRVGMWNSSITGRYMAYGNRTLEVLILNISKDKSGALISMSNSYAFVLECIKLRIIDISVNIEAKFWESNAFTGCLSLEEVRIKSLQSDIIFKDSTLLSKDSVLFMIRNAIPASAITITLHPNAYARLADDADIVAALEAQPLISLVSA